ncbi:DUF4174 domain-containing protein [Granulicella cerasi]|uniref:DUF4174 domain-containing protein n=1 Tax=Granulicella cerasi TaxID=741063 RepID=A0ABW1Z791_9BACT|nr:DUF4174 domain-containing protein [Granulicella cerasi]
MRRLTLALVACTLAAPTLAQTATKTAADSHAGKKLVPARRCLVYEDDPEAMPAASAPTKALATAPAADSTVHPIVLPARSTRAVAATTKTAPTTKAAPTNSASTAKPAPSHRPVATIVAANHLPPRPTASRPVAASAADAPVAPAPYSANPIQQLRGNARVLLLFAPSLEAPDMQTEVAMLERHQLELTHRNTVLVPILGKDSNTYIFNGEFIRPGTPADLASARDKFGIKPNQFAIVLLDEDGIERTRWLVPVSASDLDDQIDVIDEDAGVVHSLHDKQ